MGVASHVSFQIEVQAPEMTRALALQVQLHLKKHDSPRKLLNPRFQTVNKHHDDHADLRLTSELLPMCRLRTNVVNEVQQVQICLP